MMYRAVDFSGEWCVLRFEGEGWQFAARRCNEAGARALAEKLNRNAAMKGERSHG